MAYNAPHWPFPAPNSPNDRRTKTNYGPEVGTRGDYAKMVERMDQDIGKLLAALDETGVAKNTLVLFLSDNGGERLSDNGPLFHGKYTLWEGGIRVPCLLRWPGVLPKKKVYRGSGRRRHGVAGFRAEAPPGTAPGDPLPGTTRIGVLAGLNARPVVTVRSPSGSSTDFDPPLDSVCGSGKDSQRGGE